MTPPVINGFAKKLSQALQEMYNKAAACKMGLLSPVAIDRGINLLDKLGYPKGLTKELPQTSADLAFPCANPLPKVIGLNPLSILDLGCGTGLDALFCANLLPSLKRLTGLDASSALLSKGEELLYHFPTEAQKITLLQGDLNKLNDGQNDKLQPADLILMNGSFNLVYDKNNFFAGLAPLLNRNGTLLIYDFLLTQALPPGFVDDIDNWLWNIGGALNVNELEKVVSGAGLKIVEIDELERIEPVARCEIIISHPT